MGYALVTPPASEPITRAEAKLHLRIITDPADTSTHPDDALIDALIAAARQFAEQETKRSLMTQTWKYTADAFPRGDVFQSSAWLREFSIPDQALVLEKGPVSAVASITYLDMTGQPQTMASTDYTVDASSPLARITPVFGKIWPPTLPQIGAVQVQFTAGYGDASAVPSGIKAWMKLRVGALYENREEIVVGTRLTSIDLPFVDRLLDPYRIEVA
jgi:uncharacterized phiE125 gp8 family phage protein